MVKYLREAIQSYAAYMRLSNSKEKNEDDTLSMEEEASSNQHMASRHVGSAMNLKYDFSWMVPIEVMLGSLFHGEVQACSISNVRDELREVKEDAFKPKQISIGPLHRGATRHLQLMEEPKWHYTRGFLGRQGTIEQQNRSSEERLKDCGYDIHKLHIKETTEVKWRNLIAWEQSKIWIKCKYTSYALFFKGLICCEHDIEFLKKKRVIVNDMKKLSNKDLLILFRTISKGAENMDFSYSETCEKLNVPI